MEKEVREMLEKGEKVTLVVKKNTVLLSIGEEFELSEIESNGYFFLQSKSRRLNFACTTNELNEIFELKQPKDPNELIGRKVKGFRFDDCEKKYAHYHYNDGNEGEIINYDNTDDSYLVQFINNRSYFPAYQIKQHLLPEKKTKKERIEELEKRVEQLEKAVKIGMDELTKITTLRINGKIKEYEKKAPEFWYVDIVEEKDSELLPTFEEWFSKKVGFGIRFEYSYYGYSNCGHYDGYDWVTYTRDWEGNSDKMQKITLNQWNTWFNK